MAAGVVVAMLLVAGCEGGGDAAMPPSPRSSASARTAASSSQAAEKTRAQVVSDYRFAAEGFGEGLRVTKDPLGRECVVDAMALSRDLPGKDALLRVVSRLEKRGWRLDGKVSVEEGAFLKVGKWTTIVGVAPVPEEVKAQASPNIGSLLLSALGKCNPS